MIGIDVPYHAPLLRRKISLYLPGLEVINAPALYLQETLKCLRRNCRLTRIALQTDAQPSASGNNGFSRSSMKALLNELTKFPSVKKLELHFGTSGSLDFCDLTHEMQLPERYASSVENLSFLKYGGRIFDSHDLVGGYTFVMSIGLIYYFRPN